MRQRFKKTPVAEVVQSSTPRSLRATVDVDSFVAPRSQSYPLLLRWFYPERGNFIGFVSNLRSRHALANVVGAFKANCDFPAEYLASPPDRIRYPDMARVVGGLARAIASIA